MRTTRRLTILMAAIALVSACQARTEVAVVARRATTRASAAPRPAQAPTPGPSAAAAPNDLARPAGAGRPSPGGQPSSAPTGQATLAPAARLERPKTPVQVLRGAIRIDAAYALQAAGKLIADSGGGIISNNGGTVLALADAGVLSNQGGNLIANNGGGLVANNGGALVANNGGALVATSAGALNARNTAGYKLFQAPATAKLGEVLPAAGIVLQATSLRDGRPIPLGVDGAGAPVFAIRTDLAGAYEIYVPAELAGNVLVTADLPQAADPRLRYAMLVPVAAGEARPIDEDSALVSRYQRRVYVNALVDIFAAPDIDAMVKVFESYDNVPPALRGVMVGVAREFRAEGDKVGLSKASRTEIEAVAERLADVFSSRVDFDAVTIGPEALPVGGLRRAEGEKVLGEAAIPLSIRVMKTVRERAAELLAQDPQFFAHQAWYSDGNAARVAAGRPAIEIKRPSDVSLFVVDVFMTSTNGDVWDQLDAAAATMGVTADPQSGVLLGSAMFAVATATGLSVGAVMFGDPEAKAEALAMIGAWRPATPQPQAAASPP